MVSSRIMELLEKASAAFEVQRGPFSIEWLTQNHVTLQECVDRSELISKTPRDHWLSHKEEEGNQ